MKTDHELLEILRKYAYTEHPGKMEHECVVDKIFLNEVADRLEELAFTSTDLNLSSISLKD